MPDFLQKYFRIMTEKLSELSSNQRLFAIIGTAVIIGVIITLFIWAFKANYSYLYTNLDPAIANDITQKLESHNIPYRLSKAGGAIMVPENLLYNARMKLAAEGLPNSKHNGFEIFDETNLGMTDFVQKINYRRALEGELARSIQELEPVDEARVHLVIPEYRLFQKDQKDPTASIVLTIKYEGALSRYQITGITHLVASSVEGLKSTNITVVDQYSNLLTPENDENSIVMASSKQIELQRNVEKYLEQKALQMIENVVGENNAIVKVSAEVDFDQVQRTIESYDPDMVAVRSEERVEETNPGGSTGGQENASVSGNASSETVVTNYEVSKTIQNIAESTGNITKLSVAVIVDGNYVPAEDGEGDMNGMKYVPRSSDELERLSNIVKHAVGFRDDRGDKFQLENLRFDTTQEMVKLEELKTQRWHQWVDTSISYVIKLALFIGTLIIIRKVMKLYKAYRKNKEEAIMKMIEEEEAAKLAKEIKKPKLLDQIIVAANENPAEMARVIKTIMAEE
jgi:flagellar M-ring protein FliF